MRIPASWARRMAENRRARNRDAEAVRWYERLGEERMNAADRLAYAGLLHEIGRVSRALRVMDDWLAAAAHPEAYAMRASLYRDIGRASEAADDLTEAIRLDDSPSGYWHARSLAFHALGDDDRAVSDMREAAQRADGARLVSIQYELGSLCLRAGRFDDAVAALERAVGSGGGAVPLYRFRLGEALEGAGRREEALAEVDAAAESQARLRHSRDGGEAYLRERTGESPAAVRALMAVADGEYGFRMKQSQLLEDIGRPEEALAAIERAMADYPEAEDLLLRQGALLRLTGRHEQSAAVLRRVRERSPDRLAAYLELHATYRAQHRWPEAIEILRQALVRYPRQMVLRFWLVDAYRDSGAAEQAWTASKALTELEPDDPLNWRQQAELAIDMGKLEEADEAYTKALAMDESAEYYMRRSFARYLADRYEDALLDLQKATDKDPSLNDQARTAYAAAELYMGMGSRELAEQEYGRAIRQDPGNPLLFERRAQCRLALSRLAEALEDCHAGLALDAGHLRLLRLQSLIHWRLEEHELALRDMQSYVRKAPEDEQGHRDLAMIYTKLSMYDEAMASLNRALQLSPFDAPLYLDRASLYYHHLYDRGRAAQDLAQWLLYVGIERPQSDRFSLLGELDGFDDELRETAKLSYLNGYGTSRYLS